MATLINQDVKACPSLDRMAWPCMRCFLLGKTAPCSAECRLCNSHTAGKGTPEVRKRARAMLAHLTSKGLIEDSVLAEIKQGASARA